MPAGLPVDGDRIDRDLQRRQGGYGRSGRQKIERDHAEFLGGLQDGRTTGAPIAIGFARWRITDDRASATIARASASFHERRAASAWIIPSA